jgi:large subunit ribosomal protein L1
VFTGEEIFATAKEVSKERNFAESFEVIVKLNVDPTQGDQNVRGTCVLPAGTGKEVKVCVFSGNEFHEELTAAGADFLGNDAILKEIGEGIIPFDKIIATPEFMSTLKAYARVLGPKGLMPNIKSGTLVKQHELVETVKLSK